MHSPACMKLFGMPEPFGNYMVLFTANTDELCTAIVGFRNTMKYFLQIHSLSCLELFGSNMATCSYILVMWLEVEHKCTA